MNKYNNPRLTNTTIAGSGMKHPVRPHVIIGDPKNGYIQGDLMDANAVKEIAKESVNDIVDGAPEALDTLKELADAIQENGVADLVTKELLLAGLANKADQSDIVQSDWNLRYTNNLSYIKNKPTKLSDFQNDLKLSDLKNDLFEDYPEIQVGQYLYSDYTWGDDPTGAIGICVISGRNALINDGYARFAALTRLPLLYKYSTETVYNSGALNVYNGELNTDALIALGSEKYPAAAACRAAFDGNGYLPAVGEWYVAQNSTNYLSSEYTFLSSTLYKAPDDDYTTDETLYCYGDTLTSIPKSDTYYVWPFIKIRQPHKTFATSADINDLIQRIEVLEGYHTGN